MRFLYESGRFEVVCTWMDGETNWARSYVYYRLDNVYYLVSEFLLSKETDMSNRVSNCIFHLEGFEHLKKREIVSIIGKTALHFKPEDK